MAPHLIAYEIGGQRRCTPVQSGLKYRIGDRSDCHFIIRGSGISDAVCSVAFPSRGKIQILDDAGKVDHETRLPIELDIGPMVVTLFQPEDLLAMSPADKAETLPVEIVVGSMRFDFTAARHALVIIGSASNADIVLPFGPQYAIALTWNGGDELQLAALDNTEVLEWHSGESDWGREEIAHLPVAIAIGIHVVYVDRAVL
jgi:hypothetical protein